MELPILDCRSCGACCSDVGLPPYTVHELFGLPEELRSSILQELKGTKANPRGSTCSRFDLKTKACTIYPHRPAVCRDLEVGGHLCLHYRAKPARPPTP